MPPDRRQRIGNWGENLAAAFLEDKGYQVLAHNIRTPYGEIDLVAKDASELVFVEVKTRTSLQFGYPEQAVTVRKLEHMVAAAQAYVEDHQEMAVSGWRIDVVAILRHTGRANERDGVEVLHFENVAG
jgi:putative endonuclease